MKADGPATYSAGRAAWVGGPGSIYLGVVLLVVMAFLSRHFANVMGPQGLIFLSAGLLGAIFGMILVFKYPVWLGMIWFLSMSGLHTLGMLRMPGLPDFSFPRLFMMTVLLLLVIGFIIGRAVPRPPYLPDLLLYAFTFYIFLNMYTIGDPLRLNTWLTSCFAPMVAFVFGRHYVKTEAHLRWIFTFFILITTYFWITSFGEHFDIPAIVWPRQIMDRDVGNAWFGRSRGPFIQPALFGQIIGMYLIVHMFCLTRKIKKFWKVMITLNLGLGLMGLLYTYTRGGWLATAMGFVVLAVLRPRFRKLVIAVTIVGVIVASLGLLAPKEEEFLAERMETTNTIDNRLGFMANATRMIRDNPVFGVGYFRFNEFRHLYNQGTYIPFYGFIKKKAGADVSIHDIYIGRAAEEGMLGLFLFLAFWASIVWEFSKRWRRRPEGEWFDMDTLGMIGAFSAAYFVGGMAIDYRYFDLINVLPAFFAGIIIGFPDVKRAAWRPEIAPQATQG